MKIRHMKKQLKKAMMHGTVIVELKRVPERKVRAILTLWGEGWLSRFNPTGTLGFASSYESRTLQLVNAIIVDIRGKHVFIARAAIDGIIIKYTLDVPIKAVERLYLI